MGFITPLKVIMTQSGPRLLDPATQRSTDKHDLPSSSSSSSSASSCLQNIKKGRNRGDSKPKKNNGNRLKKGPKVTPSFQLPPNMYLSAKEDSETPGTSECDQSAAAASLSTESIVTVVEQTNVIPGSEDVNKDNAVLLTEQAYVEEHIHAVDTVINDVQVHLNEIETETSVNSVPSEGRDEPDAETYPTSSSNKSSEFTCDTCKKVFTRLKCYGKHISKCDKDLSCASCKKSFKNTKTLRQHLLKVHLDTKKCELCGERFSTEKKLEKHRIRSHSIAQIKCENCNEVYKNKKSLSVHKAKKVCPALVEAGKKVTKVKDKKNTRLGKYQCDQCQKSYGSKRGLRYHKQCHRMVTVQTEEDEDQNTETLCDITVETSNVIPEGVEGVDYFVLNVLDSI